MAGAVTKSCSGKRMPLYLVLDLLAISIPLAFSFENRLQFFRLWKGLFPSILIVGLAYIVWDSIFTKNGVWGFNPEYLVGIYFFNLPLEEYLFFICVPYAGVFTFHVFKTLMPEFNIQDKTLQPALYIVAVILIIVGLLFKSRAYTHTTFYFTAVSLAVSFLFFRPLLPHFILSYAAILLPFFIMNGILTGMWIEKEVVWYNDEENLGIRLVTIPVEDVFYGMALILWNVNLTYFFQKRISKNPG
jgi:lycopene cyclase domain-containing protein